MLIALFIKILWWCTCIHVIVGCTFFFFLFLIIFLLIGVIHYYLQVSVLQQSELLFSFGRIPFRNISDTCDGFTAAHQSHMTIPCHLNKPKYDKNGCRICARQGLIILVQYANNYFLISAYLEQPHIQIQLTIIMQPGMREKSRSCSNVTFGSNSTTTQSFTKKKNILDQYFKSTLLWYIIIQ